MIIRPSLLALMASLSACCPQPWDAFPMDTPPDRSCHMGTTHGHTLYIWECIDDGKAVIGRYTAEMGCQAPELETAECGSFTPLELQYGLDQPEADCPMAAEWRVD